MNAISLKHNNDFFKHVNNLDVWHYRLGHLYKKILDQLSKSYDDIHYDSLNVCAPCHLAKQHKLPFPLSKTRIDNAFDPLHLDIWRPFGTPSIHGHKFFLFVVDDFTRHTWVFLMKSKSETSGLLNSFVMLTKNQFNQSIKIMRTDNDQEFCWLEFYEKHGIIHQKTCVETPQQNSIVERKHNYILNITRCLMFQSKLPKVFWSYAISHFVFLINRLPSPIICDKSPFEMLYNRMPDLSNLKIFGCLYFASTLEQNRNKLDPRARKCIFLSFKPRTKGYIIIDTNNREIFVSRNVIFHENILSSF